VRSRGVWRAAGRGGPGERRGPARRAGLGHAGRLAGPGPGPERWCAIIATSLAADVGVRAWFSPGDPPGSGPVSPPSRQAGRNVTAWLFLCQRDHRHGQAPWPGPRRDLVGRAEAPHARGARAGPSAGGYGSASLFSSPRPATHFVGTRMVSPALGNRTSGAFTRSPVVLEDRSTGDDMSPACGGRHPKVPAGVESSAAAPLTRRCHRGARRGARGSRPRSRARATPRCGWPRQACPRPG